MGSRKPEIIIGLIGSIIGILVGFWIINYGDSVTDYIQTFTYLPGELGNELANLGWITLIASVVALIASLLIKSAPRGWGVILVIIGIVLFFVIGTAWIISGILITLTGLMGIFRRPVPLDIKDGEFFVFIGPSGCGKTTTLKMINRLIPLTTGTIYINEKRISDYDIHELRWDIGYVLQQIALFPHMTIEENIAIVPELKKWSKEKIHDRITELLDSVGLDPESYRHRKPAELSGGEQQRVGVVRALAADPGIILMDEPFSALDPISRQRLQQDISALQKKIKKTIVFVTHDMQEALALGDRICVMQGGEIVQVATPQEIMKNPENDFVKDFLASGHAFNTPILEANFTVKDLIEADLFYSYQTSDGTLGISSAEPVENLVRRIAEEQSIPVTDEAGNFIGTVSNKHVMQFLARHLESSGELV